MPDSPRTPTSIDAAAYLAAIVESSDDAIVSKDLSGIIRSWNKGAEGLFGYTAAEAIGQSMLLIIPPDRHAEEVTILERLRQGRRIHHYETQRRRKDGRLIDVSLTISPIRDQNGHIIGASKIARDITNQKTAQRELTEAKNRLAVTLQSIGDAVIATDLHSRVTFVNPLARTLLGRTDDDILGRPLTDVFVIVNEETRRPVESPVDRVLREGTVVGLANHTVLMRPDGTELPIDDSAAPIMDDEGRLLGTVMVFRDVSERRKAEHMAALMSAIVASSDDAIISKDLTGTVTSWNRGAERIFGYTAEEMIGQSIRRLIPPDKQDEEADILARLARGERIDHYRTVRRRKNGQLFHVSITVSPITNAFGRIVGISKISRDITEQIRAQEALQESQERWRVTLHSIGDAVIATDPDGYVTFANPIALALLGRVSQDVIDRPLTDVFHIVNEETRRPVANPVDRVIREGVIVGLANHTVLIRPGGSEVPIDDSAAPIRNEEGRLVGVVLVFRDVTERKQRELQLQRWRGELEQRVGERTHELVRSQERLRTLATQLSLTEQRERRRLATNLHDYLAQLLVLGRMKIGQTKQRLKPKTSALETMLAETDDILEQCLRYTRTLMAQLSPSVLHDLGLIAALKWLAEQMQQQGLTVHLRILREDLPLLSEAQADLLFQAVRELLLNIIKHAQVSEATVSLDMRTNGDLILAVEDQGVGFDFATVQYRPTGEHFGLFSIQERMESMSGWCAVDSAPGRGTRVELGLQAPQKEGSAARPLPPQAVHERLKANPTKSGQSRRILLIDDHAMVRQGLRSILNTYADLQIIAEAADGEEAVRLAQQHRPDVVIMDINLPRLNGIEATRRIKEALSEVVIIGLSVQWSAQTLEALLAAGGATLLSKEQATEDLYRTIVGMLQPPRPEEPQS